MSLFDLMPAAPAPVSTPDAPQQKYAVRIKQTRSGREIMVVTAPVAPPEVIAEAVEKGLPLFTGPEIMRLTDCDPELVEHILSVKTTFPGCTVQQILSGAVQA